VNIGFGGACNRGAIEARGRVLAFVSDDAAVPPGWLEACCRTADEHPGWGAIASVLLEPDGSVQEAGSRILHDGRTVAFAIETGVIRELDYGSGAALVVDATIFRELGGFDPAFYPAYYEDTDLACRLRLAGHSVLLQPSERVLHIGRGSSRDLGEFQRYASEHGLAQFQARWAKALAGAAAVDAPLSELLPIEAVAPIGTVMRSEGLDLVEEWSTETGALRILRVWTDGFVAWLNATILDERRQHGELLARLREAAQQSARLDVVARRLEEIEGRGFIGLARMRMGVLLRRRRVRRP
jgi:hypothetical protein